MHEEAFCKRVPQRGTCLCAWYNRLHIEALCKRISQRGLIAQRGTLQKKITKRHSLSRNGHRRSPDHAWTEERCPWLYFGCGSVNEKKREVFEGACKTSRSCLDRRALSLAVTALGSSTGVTSNVNGGIRRVFQSVHKMAALCQHHYRVHVARR